MIRVRANASIRVEISMNASTAYYSRIRVRRTIRDTSTAYYSNDSRESTMYSASECAASAERRVGESASRAAHDLQRLELREADQLRERADLRVVVH